MRGKYILIVTGLLFLMIAVGCFGFEIWRLQSAFTMIATSTSSPQPADLAHGISEAQFWGRLIEVPSAIIGIVLLMTGFVYPSGDRQNQ